MTTLIDLEIPHIARELHLAGEQVEATVGLLDDGATAPFIARYRKERTGSLDEVAITSIRDRLSQLRELRDRREIILASLEKRGLLSQELRKALLAAQSMAVLEDTYLPHRPRGAPGPPSPGKGDWSPWRCASGVRGILTSPQPLTSTSIPKRGWITPKRRCVEPGTSSPSGSAKTPPRGGKFGSSSGRRALSPQPVRSGFIHQFGQFQHLFGGDDGAQPNLDSHALSSGADMADPASPARVWAPMLAAAMNRIPGQRVPELPGERP